MFMICLDPADCEEKGYSNKKLSFINNKYIFVLFVISFFNIRELLKTDMNNNPVKYMKDNLLEHHDYEAVSKEIYKNMKKWYNVDIDIIRFLKLDPLINNKLYLDIYPEKRKKNNNSIDAHHSKRNGWSMDIQNFSNFPKQILSNSRHTEDFNDGTDIYSQSMSIYLIC